MKIMRYSSGGMIDERIPRDMIESLLRASNIDAEQFCDLLEQKIGAYRFNQENQNSAPSRSEEVDALNAMVRVFDQTIAALDFEALPPIANALVNDSLWKVRGGDKFDVRQTLLDDMFLYRAAVESASHELQKMSVQRGRKKAGLRDALLASVVSELREKGLTRQKAGDLAEQILIACRVPMPEDARAQRRATARGQK